MKYQHMRLVLASVSISVGLAGCSYDFYNPTPTTFELQTLGNSYLDYQNKYAAVIPSYLNQFASAYYKKTVVYKDRAVSGTNLDSILVTTFDAARNSDLVNADYAIKTMVINGGENDIREECVGSATTASDGSYVSNSSCENAIAVAKQKIQDFFVRINSQTSINKYGYPPAIVWLGRYNMPGTVVHKNIVSDWNAFMKAQCAAVNRCYFVDMESAWSSSDAYKYLDNNDRYATNGPVHVNAQGGQILAQRIWNVLTDPANNLYF